MDLLARFHLTALPLTREIAVDRHFTQPQFAEALEGLRRTVERRMSAALIAPAGCGKTALLRALAAGLPQARYHVHYVKVTSLSKRDMCRELASACGLAAASSYPALVRRIQDGVRERTDTDGQRTVLMLDEAHEMRPDVLGMLRVITNFEMDSRLVLSFVLAGQPPLATLLRRPELEDLARRIAHYATLRPLSREETRDYVAHRLAVAGSATLPFDAGSLEALFEIGRGNLRATDNLALGALETAALRGHDVVDTNHVVEARKSLCP